jgi:hypothetical protein
MRTFVTSLGVLALLPASLANAADMPVKAPVTAAPACTVTMCSGFYAGGDLIGVMSNVDIIGSGVNNSIFAGGEMIGAHAGWQFWNGRFFAAFEAGAAYQSSNKSASNVLGSDRVLAMELAKFGVGLSGLFGGISTAPASIGQSPVPVSIPASLSDALIAPYIITGTIQGRKRGSQALTGAGSEFLLASHYSLSVDYLYGAPMDSNPALQMLRVGLNYKF